MTKNNHLNDIRMKSLSYASVLALMQCTAFHPNIMPDANHGISKKEDQNHVVGIKDNLKLKKKGARVHFSLEEIFYPNGTKEEIDISWQDEMQAEKASFINWLEQELPYIKNTQKWLEESMSKVMFERSASLENFNLKANLVGDGGVYKGYVDYLENNRHSIVIASDPQNKEGAMAYVRWLKERVKRTPGSEDLIQIVKLMELVEQNRSDFIQKITKAGHNFYQASNHTQNADLIDDLIDNLNVTIHKFPKKINLLNNIHSNLQSIQHILCGPC